jgi:drug/metabolite transporter (DMT)-like permease
MGAPPAKSPASRTRQAVLALFVVTLIWGGTFVWMKEALEVSALHLGPGRTTAAIALFTFLRFGSAAALVFLAVPAARRGLTREAWRGGVVLGGLLFIGFVLQMFGLESVTPAVSAFLTSLYVLFTALLSAIAARRGLGLALIAGTLLATLGAGLIRGRPELAFELGELLTVASAFVFALHILATDRITRATAPMPVTLTSFAVVALGSLALCAVSALLDPPPASALSELLRDPAYLQPTVLSAVLATVVAITLMNVFQRELEPVRAAILYACEPIWATLFGWYTGHNTIDGYLWIGGSLLLAGNLVAELGQQRAARRTSAA